MFTGDDPIFQQLAAAIADDIVSGAYPEETAIPSAAEFALYHQINPATASKGVNLLVEGGALYKRRGVGMFVANGARELLKSQRREQFRERFVRPLLAEAALIGIDGDELARLVAQATDEAAFTSTEHHDDRRAPHMTESR